MQEIFEKLGLGNEEALILQHLVKNGAQTVLQISRATGIKRTNAYRIIDQLESDSYIVKRPSINTSLYAPLSLQYLTLKIEEKAQEAILLKETFLNTKPTLQQYYSAKTNNIGANYYNGGEEVKQLLWNSLFTNNKTIKSFGYRSLNSAVGSKFKVKWWNENILRGIKTIMIANPSTFETKKSADTNHQGQLLESSDDLFQTRFLPTRELEITTETFIYNNVYSVIQWDDNDVFGIEIINDSVRKQEEEIFDYLWKKAKPWKKELMTT
jgi:sugar-specific transcriptional regulator TrmB